MRNTVPHSFLSGLLLTGLGTLANAQLTTTRTDLNPTTTNYNRDGIISANEYGAGNAYSFSGGGTGFGGTVGNGTLYMDFDATNLNIGLQLGADLNDYAVIYFDTKAGGFNDNTMSDTSDGGRNLTTNLTANSDDVLPFQADYAVVMGNFGIVGFELTGGSLNVPFFDGTFTGNSAATAREVSFDKSLFSIGSSFDFLAVYGSSSNFMSNESIPNQGIAANPGFGDGTPVQWTNYNRFQVVPSPAAWSVFALGGLPVLSLLRRRK